MVTLHPAEIHLDIHLRGATSGAYFFSEIRKATRQREEVVAVLHVQDTNVLEFKRP